MIEFFSISNLKPLWKSHDEFAPRSSNFASDSTNQVIRRIVFHPFRNIIFPGQLDPVLNFEGNHEHGPIKCSKRFGKFECCCLSHDNKKMATCYMKVLTIWNLLSNKTVGTIPCSLTVYSILFSGNDRYIATRDFTSFKVYDTENSYSMISCRNNCYELLVSTLDSWCFMSVTSRKGSIFTYDLTKQQNCDIDFLLFPCKNKAENELQAIMQNRSPMWLQKLRSCENFFILNSNNVLCYKRSDRELKIFRINELIKGTKLKQEYDKCSATKSIFVCEESAIFSADGKYIYTTSPYIDAGNPMFSFTQRGKSWKLVPIEYTPLLPVTNGVFLMKVKRDHVAFDESTPELWNTDLTECLFIFHELTGIFHCLSVTENLVACIMTSEVRFVDVAKKKIVARTQIPQYNSSDLSRSQHAKNVKACGSQYHVVYTKDKNTLLLQKTKVVNLSELVLINLKPATKYIHTACFSIGGGLLAFASDNRNLIHVLDISTYKICRDIFLNTCNVKRLEFFDEAHLLCQGNLCTSFTDNHLLLINVKSGDMLTTISVGVDFLRKWRISVCRKTGDIVVLDVQCKKLKLFKLWLPHQRRNKNEL